MQRIPGVESAAVALSVPYESFINNGLKIVDGKLAGVGEDASELRLT